MKVVVYAICKNEEKFIKRWYESMKEADLICVLDTGSTDNSVALLKELGCHVTTKIITPWRFDVARNESLKLIPNDTDICVCTDIDEVFNSGWRCELEKIWHPNTTQARYIYNWNHDEQGKALISFYYEKIHALKNFKWVNPVHEILDYSGEINNIITLNNITLDHYPDDTKSRSSYLPLLELAVKENPNNDRNMHYLGREYMFYQEYHKSIDTLINHLNMASAVWIDERCASMRFIARDYMYLKRFEEAKMWIEKSKKEASHIREPFMEAAIIYYQLNNYDLTIKNAQKALKIKNETKSYINEPFCSDLFIYDILSVSYYQINDYINAYKYIKKALLLSNEERLIKNQKLIIDQLKSSN